VKTAALTLVLCAIAFADSPRIVYTKEFPGSTPAWVSIAVERSGDVVYKEAANDELPAKFKLRDDEAQEIFRLTDKLDRFSRPLESNLKVARMGIKTFRFEDGATKHEVKFNYSLDEDAKALADWFERITESEQYLMRLEVSVKYEKLGVNDALLRLQSAWERKRLVGAEQFLPLLDRVIKNESYLHMARERAAALADSIRSQMPPKAE
jgi:hypothetical protein